VNVKKKDLDLQITTIDTFKNLVTWRPLLKVTLPCSDPGGDFAPTKFCISEKQGDKSTSIENKEKSLSKILLKFKIKLQHS
jgi:hypothetical protein